MPLPPKIGFHLPTAKHRFGRDVLLSGIASGVRSLRHFLFLPVLTYGLDEIQLGLWELLMVSVGLAIPWISLQLPGAIVRFLPGVEEPRDQREIAYALFFLALGSSVLLAVLWGIGGRYALADTPWSPLRPLLPIVVVLAIATTGLESVRSFFRARRLILHHTGVGIAQYFGELVLVGYALWYGSGLSAGLWAMLAIRAILLTIGAAIVIRQLGWHRPSFARWREFLCFSIPLIPNSALYRLFDFSDRYLLAHFLGTAAVGTYFVSYTAASFFATLTAPLHLVLLPTIAEFWNRGDREQIAVYLREAVHYTLIASLPALVTAVLLPTELLALVTPASYNEAAHSLSILALGFFAFSLGVPADHLLVAAGRTRVLFAVNSTMLVGNVVLNILLITRLGIPGAAIATLAGHLIYALATLILARRIIPFAIPWRTIFFAGANAFLMGVLIWSAKPHLHPLLSLAGGALLYFLLSLPTKLLGAREWHYLRGLLAKR